MHCRGRAVRHRLRLGRVARRTRLHPVRPRRQFHPRPVWRVDVQNAHLGARWLDLHSERPSKQRQRHPMHRRDRAVCHGIRLRRVARGTRLHPVRPRRQYHDGAGYPARAPRPVRRTDVQNPHPRMHWLHLHRERLLKAHKRHPVQRRHRAVRHGLRLRRVARCARLHLVRTRRQLHPRPVRQADVQNAHLRVHGFHLHRERLLGVLLHGDPRKRDNKQRTQARRH